MIEVLVVDDHTIFRSGLRRLLGDETDMRVCEEAGNAADAMQLLRQASFDAVILDINLKGRSGLDLLKSLRREWPALPVLMVSMYPEEQFARAALDAGANGYVAKDAEPGDLLYPSHRRGGTWLSTAFRARRCRAGRRRATSLLPAHGARDADDGSSRQVADGNRRRPIPQRQDGLFSRAHPRKTPARRQFGAGAVRDAAFAAGLVVSQQGKGAFPAGRACSR